MQDRNGVSHPRLAPGTAVRIRSQHWRVVQLTAHARNALVEVAGAEAGNRGTRATFLLPAEHVVVRNSESRPRPVRAEEWRRLARAALGHGVATFDSLWTAAASRISLLPFQLEPALALTRGLGSRVLIADDVGLGKTIQAGLVAAEILSRHAGARVLIVTPAALREQWAAELDAKFALRAAVLEGRTLAVVGGAPHVNPWSAHPVIVTSIDFVKRPEVLRGLEPLVWDLVVFDEAHTLGGASDRGSAAEGLARRSRRVVLLSATPHSGDDPAFARLCRLGSLDRDPLLVFRRTRGDAGLTAGRRTVRLRVRPSPAEIAMHRALREYAHRVWRNSTSGAASRLAMIVLLKRACSSAAALGRSLERRLHLLASTSSPAGTQVLLPFNASDDDAEPLSVLGAGGLPSHDEECRQLESLLALAQAASRGETKLAALRRLLRRVRQPAIVFTEYRDTLAHLVATIPVSSVQIHGGLTASERRDAVRAFTERDARVLFATDAASEGLNLQRRCRLVVTLELPWSPVRLAQRIGRVDRIGQPARVHAVQLLATGTPEEQVAAHLSQRESRARTWLGSHGAADEAIGEAIVAGAQAPAGSRAPDVREPHGLVFPYLRADAEEEAQRLAVRRALLEGARDAVIDRPVVALVRSHRTDSMSRAYVCAHVPFVDSAHRVHWRALVGAEAIVQPADRCAPPTLPLWNALAAEVLPVASARRSVLAWVRLSIARERALTDDLVARHGRLASYQAALFDRRAERRMTGQAAALESALARCRERLQLLEALVDAMPGAPEPLFTVVVR